MDSKTETVSDKHGLTVFEMSEDGIVQPASYRRGSIFISFSQGNSETNETFVLVKKEGCKYVRALNKKNALRKFNSQSPDTIK